MIKPIKVSLLAMVVCSSFSTQAMLKSDSVAKCNGDINCITGTFELDPTQEQYDKGIEQAKEIVSQKSMELPASIKESLSTLQTETTSSIDKLDFVPKSVEEIEDAPAIVDVASSNKETLTSSKSQSATEKKFGKLTDKSLWEVSDKATRLLSTAIQKRQETNKYDAFEGFIFISRSIPANDLSALIEEVSLTNRKIAFVVRGFEPKQMAQTVQDFVEINKKFASRLILDPTLFRKYNVTEVPTFLIREKLGEGQASDTWRITKGDVSLRMAEEHFDHTRQFEYLGKVYPIQEPDLLALIQERVERTDWKTWVDEQTKIIETQKFAFDVGVARTQQTYSVDPTYTLTQDIVLKGHTFGRKGQKLNPLEIMPLTKCYLFADFNDESHRNAVDKLISKCDKKLTKAISVQQVASADAKYLVEKYGVISVLDPLLKERMGISRVPAMARQVGNGLIVTTLPPIKKENADEKNN
jgi:type-F conjugative transfer system pilin assembly protein TrbC